MKIQWYPGHMTKARRMLEDSLKKVDVVVELLDARAPASSRNPDFLSLFSGKRRVLILNKSDLADPAKTQAFVRYYKEQGEDAMAFSFASGKSAKAARQAVSDAAKDLIERSKARGMNRTVRAMAVGIPNVGKSTFINRLRGGSPAKTSDRPGVTRGGQWIVIHPHLEFLDTPGMLWPKFEDETVAKNLAFLGSIRDQIMDGEALCAELLLYLMEKYPERAMERFKITEPSDNGELLLEAACHGRGWLMSGGRPDTARGSAVILDEFRAGRLGAITIDDLPGASGASDA